MRKFFNYLGLVIYILLPIYFLCVLVGSIITGHNLNDMIDTTWWMFFFLFEIWVLNIGKPRLDEALTKIKEKK